MRKGSVTFLIIFSVIFSFCLLSPDIPYSASVIHIAEKASRSVVMIVVYDITGEQRGQGSGFFIDDKGRVITNAHVMDDAYSAEVISESNYYGDVTLLKLDELLDLALVQVEAIEESPLQFNFKRKIRPGERVVAIGNPLGLEKSISDGLISAIRHYGEIEYIQTTAPISPGSSGGPLLNLAGEVVGVTTAAFTEGQNLNFAISANSIQPFLIGPQKAQRLHPPRSKVWFRWLLKWVGRGFLALITLAFGGGYWLIGIIIFVIVAVYWLFRYVFIFLLWPIRHFKKKRVVRLEDKVKRLHELINYHRHKYYIDKSPEISDSEYDHLKVELETIEKAHPELITWDSPTQLSGSYSSSSGTESVFYCWKCGTQLSATSTMKGYAVECPECGTELKIPDE